MSSSSDVLVRRPRIVRSDAGSPAPLALPEIPSPAGQSGAVCEPVDTQGADSRATYDRGWADGHAAAVDNTVRLATQEAALARAEARRLAASLGAAIAELRAREAVELHSLTDQIADAAISIAEALVAVSNGGIDPALAALARALDIVPSRSVTRILVHADDVHLMADACPTVEVAADPAVPKGGCVVEAGASTVDGGLDAAVARVRAALLGGEEAW